METKEYLFHATDEYVRPIGRTAMLGDTRILSLSGSGVEFKFTGCALRVTFYGDTSTSEPNGMEAWRDQARVQVMVDDIIHIDTMIKKTKETYAVFGFNDWEDKTPKEHTVRITKLSEPRMSAVGLGEIAILATNPAKPTLEAEKLVEFIGDSITCGYGIDAKNEWQTFSTTTENATKAYAYLTAKKMGWDYSLVSYSGHGLISGYTGDPDTPLLTELVPPYYEILAYSYNQFQGQKLEEIAWDFETNRKPDYVIINLGTNDDSYIQDTESKRLSFLDAYVKFLGQVHDKNPEATIVATFGLMGDRLCETEREAVEKFKKQSGYECVYFAPLTPQNADKNGYGSDWHPSAVSHEEASEELVAFLRKL